MMSPFCIEVGHFFLTRVSQGVSFRGVSCHYIYVGEFCMVKLNLFHANLISSSVMEDDACHDVDGQRQKVKLARSSFEVVATLCPLVVNPCPHSG
jgi:hypothetical protein